MAVTAHTLQSCFIEIEILGGYNSKKRRL